MVLSWSRTIHVPFALDQTLGSFLRGHVAASVTSPSRLRSRRRKSSLLRPSLAAESIPPVCLVQLHPRVRDSCNGYPFRPVVVEGAWFQGTHMAELEDISSLRERLDNVERQLGSLFRDVSLALDYAASDPEGAATKAGRAVEGMLLEVYRREIDPNVSRSMTIEQLKGPLAPHLPRSIAIHLEVVQRFRNVGAHHRDVGIEPRDLPTLLRAFVRIVEWFVERYAAESGEPAPVAETQGRKRRRLLLGSSLVLVAAAGAFLAGHQAGVPVAVDPPGSVAHDLPAPSPDRPFSRLSDLPAEGMSVRLIGVRAENLSPYSARSGRLHLRLDLVDSTGGRLSAIYFDGDWTQETLTLLRSGGTLAVDGRTSSYKGRPSLIVERVAGGAVTEAGAGAGAGAGK